MIIGIDMGHTLSGVGTGAVGYVSETVKNRELGKRLIQMLQEKGHTVINCTVDKSNNDLADRVAIANNQKLDLFISLHLNAYKSTNSEMGVETYSYSASGTGREYAAKIQNELVTSIGWKNRGLKTANFYVLRNTVDPAILVELGFCDSKGDMDKWNTEKIASALFKGITGQVYSSSAPAQAGDIYYRVICGSFKNRENAEARKRELAAKGFSGIFLEAFKK